MVACRKRILETGLTFRSVIGSMIWWRKQLEIKRSLSFWMQAAEKATIQGVWKAHLDALGIQEEFAGFDISKFAVKAAAKKYRDIQFAVGSIFDSPIESNSADCLLNIFAPIVPEEFQRIVKARRCYDTCGSGSTPFVWIKRDFV